MTLRTDLKKRKRGRGLTKRERRNASKAAQIYGPAPEANESEASPKGPLKLVTCNINNGTLSEGTEGLIADFIERTSQGDTTVRQDIEEVLRFMARTDLPREYRRGIKPLRGAKVRAGTADDPDKLWSVFEMKPTNAADLPLVTGIVKDTRVYFIKVDDQTLGIVGIVPRAQQDVFIKRLRATSKIRGAQPVGWHNSRRRR